MKGLLYIQAIFFSVHAFSQATKFSYKVAVFSPDESNSDHAIHCIARDSFGFIWGGTNKGVIRFNGYQFDALNQEVASGELPTGKVNSVVCHQGELIAGTDHGLFSINTKSYEAKRISGAPADSSSITQVLAGNNTLWWITGMGTLYRKSGKHIQQRFLFRTLNIPNLSMVYFQDDIWIYREYEGIYRLDGVSLKVKKIYNLTSHDELVKKLSVFNNALYFGSGNGVYAYRPEKDVFESAVSFDKGACNMVSLEKGFMFARFGYQFVHQFAQDNQDNVQIIPLPVHAPLRIHEMLHQEGRLFAATSLGLVLIKIYPARFENLYQTFLPQRNNFDVPRGVAEDDEHYYLATYNLLVALNKASGKLDTLLNTPLYLHWMIRQGDTLWLTSEGKGLYAYNIRTRKCTNLFTTHEGEQVFLSCLDGWGNDTIMAGGYAGLWIYNKSTRSKQQVFIEMDGKPLQQLSYNQITVLDNQRCIIATSKGAFLVNRSLQCLHHFLPSSAPNALANQVSAFTITNDGALWLGTRDGIFIYDMDGKLQQTFRTEDGIAGNRIAFLAGHTPANQVWAGTFTGLSVIDVRQKSVTNYFAEDGLPATEFNHSAFGSTQDGAIIMGTISGYVKVHPANLPATAKSGARILISKVIIGSSSGERQVIQPVYVSDARFTLGKKVNYLKIYFASDALNANRNIAYQYRIEDVHATWLDMGKEPFIYIDPVKKGKLKIHIKISNGTGSHGMLYETMEVEVQDYFYRQTWFYALLLGLLLLVSIAYIRVLRNKAKALQALRSDISSDLHDEIGGYLTALSMNIDFLHKQQQKESGYLHTIRALCRKSILALKDGLWSLDTRSDNAEQLWDRIKTIAEESFEPLQIDYAFNETEGLQLTQYKFTILEKRNLLFIIKECITNIIKHGAHDTTVRFNFVQHQQKLSIIIENGAGASRYAKTEGGLGLQNIKKRMEVIKGTAGIQTSDDTFVVILKLDFLHDPFRNYRR